MVEVQRLQVLVPYRGQNGTLSVLGQDGLPFTVARAFWLTDVPDGARRADHAHRTARQVLVAQVGEWVVTIEHRPGEKAVVLLRPNESALYVPPGAWLTVEAKAGRRTRSSRGVLLVLTDRPFSARDYVRERAEWEAMFAAPSRRDE